ncbi:MAG: hypothetical protein BMS9Abin07_2358 [Acidimicrobiia bacterium]|nr:MAG: hypothetical protein BMS9Abin07_2358 [Acidimicrobiia bacterium]
MTVVIFVVAVAVAMAIVVAFAAAIRGASSGGLAAPEETQPTELRPAMAAFHVESNTATVSYDVPLPPGEVDERLGTLLLHDAARVVREKSAAGLPIEQVERVRACGRRDGEYVEAGVLDLGEPGVIPELAAPDLVPHAATTGYDPLAHLSEQEFDVRPGIAPVAPERGLDAFTDDLELSRAVEVSLRAAGIDPAHATLEDMTLGLLGVGGYTVVPVPAEDRDVSRYMARRAGAETLIEVLPHIAGDHPELSEQAVNRFAVAVAEQNPTRAMLITDKYGPYMIYEKERRDPKCRFITRERLQPFVDSFALQ